MMIVISGTSSAGRTLFNGLWIIPDSSDCSARFELQRPKSREFRSQAQVRAPLAAWRRPQTGLQQSQN